MHKHWQYIYVTDSPFKVVQDSNLKIFTIDYSVKLISPAPLQSTGLRSVQSHKSCGAVVYGWSGGLGIFSTRVRVEVVSTLTTTPSGRSYPGGLSFFYYISLLLDSRLKVFSHDRCQTCIFIWATQ